MKATLTASTAAKIVVWREDALFYARLHESTVRPQVCMAVDLFEVIAEIAGLDLEVGEQAAEAMSLADAAQRRLTVDPPPQSDADRDDAVRHSDRVT